MIDINTVEVYQINTSDNLFLGCYVDGSELIKEAQAFTMERLLKLTPKLKKSSKILFLCGDSYFAPFYTAATYNSKVHILCSDLEKEADVKKQAEENNLAQYIQTTVGDYSYLNFDFDYFDFVWTVDVLSQIEDLLAIVRQIKGVLAPQGRLIMIEEVLNPESDLNIDTHLHTFLDILKVATTGDLEKISQIDLKDESNLHYQKLSNDETLNDNESNHVQHRKTLTEQGHISWNFIQFQKRNS
jgi:sarcosine/dimethylglycine N-methyltransferase